MPKRQASSPLPLLSSSASASASVSAGSQHQVIFPRLLTPTVKRRQFQAEQRQQQLYQQNQSDILQVPSQSLTGTSSSSSSSSDPCGGGGDGHGVIMYPTPLSAATMTTTADCSSAMAIDEDQVLITPSIPGPGLHGTTRCIGFAQKSSFSALVVFPSTATTVANTSILGDRQLPPATRSTTALAAASATTTTTISSSSSSSLLFPTPQFTPPASMKKSSSSSSGFPYIHQTLPPMSPRLRLLLQKEPSYLPNPDYFCQIQCNRLKPIARSDVLTFIKWLNKEYDYLDETLYICVNFLDRYLSLVKCCQRPMLSRLALTCFLIAAKVVEETREPLLAELADLAVRKGLIASITAKQIRDTERKILKELGFNMSVSTPYAILQEILICLREYINLKTRDRLWGFSQDYLKCTLIDFTFQAYTPSIIAVAALSLSLQEIELPSCVLSVTSLHSFMGLDDGDDKKEKLGLLMRCQEEMLTAFKKI